MSQPRDLVEQKGNQIVHIRGDSDSDLEALFNAIINPTDSQVPLTVPMRLRKLPNSFFKPPDTGSKTSQSVSHSRESSTDSTSASTCFSPSSSSGTAGQPQPNAGQAGQAAQSQAAQTARAQGASSPQQAGRQGGSSTLPVHHPRAHSSPASLQQSLAAATGQQQHQHLRQQSYDITDDVPLPPGWEMAKTATGQRYFLNHHTQTTTWDDPRKKMSMSAVNIHSPSSSSPSPPINPLSPQNLGPLPDGWEQATTPEGEIYFINHQTRSTSWFDPRIPMHLQRPNVLQQQSLQSSPPLMNSTAPQTAAPAPSQPTANSINIQQRQQRVRLQRLQMERERLRVRQQEIMRQLKFSGVNSYGQSNLISNVGRPNYMDRDQQRITQPDILAHQELLLRQTLGEALTTSPSSDLTSVTTDIDPFLGGSDFHSRQESGDSGLGMSTNYSLPHTPEDFLTTMDDSMDPASDDGSQCGQQHTADLGTLDLQGSDLTSLGDTNNMDSDDLEPSLQEELSSDILNDVEALLNNNRIDNVLTWL